MVTKYMFGESFQVLDIFSSNASLVSDCALRVDLIRCITEDHMSSHESDQLKRVTGAFICFKCVLQLFEVISPPRTL